MAENTRDLKRELLEIFFRPELPDPGGYSEVLEAVQETLNAEGPEYRPRSEGGYPGGLIHLDPSIETVVVPDLHARMDFFASLLLAGDLSDAPVMEKLEAGEMQIVCVGDGFHAEARAYDRWKAAFEEFSGGYRSHENMDAEMRESLGLMEMVMRAKTRFPRRFHFLKGNHENIANEEGHGNYPFGKFAYEGAMVTHWVKLFYGEDFLSLYYKFEKMLPLLAVGRNFLISHAEPAVFLDEPGIIDYRDNPETVYALTWTDNDAAEPGSVARMLEHYLDDPESAYYFGGHRPIRTRYNLRADGKYVQIHNPSRFVVAHLKPDGEIDPNRDIRFLERAAELKGGGRRAAERGESG